MPYIKSDDRNQVMITSLDEMVDPQSDARLIDVFVDSLDLEDMGFSKSEAAVEGRPCYPPNLLLKLYVYGARHKIRSSRKLAESCKINIEVRWLMGSLTPDHRTISDFRKDNVDCLKKVFLEFNKRLSGAVKWGFTSIDGSKFLANNSKDNNFTKNKLDDRIRWLTSHTDEYLRLLEEADESDEEVEGKLTKDELNEKLQKAQERLERYKAYQKYMEETGASQLSLIDADAKLMKSKNGFVVAYNPQTAVDSETHLIKDYQLTNQVTDHGLLNSTMEGIRKNETGIIELVADRGYEKTEDMAQCLENGVIPNVILDDGQDAYNMELEYIPSDEVDISSDIPKDISEALHAGEVPDAYKDIIEDMEVKQVRRRIYDDDITTPENPYGTKEEMIERAMEGYFVRDPERNVVYCPAGEELRQKSIKSNGYIRYSNKLACRHCKQRDKCYKGKSEWKEIDFNKDTLQKPCKDWLKSKNKESDLPKQNRKYHLEKKKLVFFNFKPDRKKMEQRMCLSEHPFGTIKRYMDASYFLLRGKRKVDGEFALMCLGYNIVRSINLIGFDKLMAIMTS